MKLWNTIPLKENMADDPKGKVLNITKDYLETAIELITGPRAHDYGNKIINHNNIAKLWSAYLDINISAHDVAVCMSLLKIARTKLGSRASDTYVDAAAYMAIAGECKEKEEENGSS